MTSFVSTATTMFNRFPLRYTRQKEPQIGSPVLVDSSRPDVLLLSGDSEKMMLPSYPGLHNTSRYTTTPDFESSPITPSMAAPPAFYQISQPISPKITSPPSTRKNTFSKKSPTSTQAVRTRPQKSVDLIAAASQTVSATSSFSSGKTSEDGPSSYTYLSSPNPPKSNQTGSLSDFTKAPRLRDSIVPTMKPLDNSFFGNLGKEKILEEYNTSPSISSKLDTRSVAALSTQDPGSSHLEKSQTILDRKHPLATIGEKIVESQTTMLNQPDRYTTPAPVLNSADEHILHLEAQRDELVAEQRYLMAKMKNIEDVLPPNPATHDLKQRASLREELRELQSKYDSMGKQLHETGMMLHRAWRRRDTKLGIEAPAVLWVRRVNQ